MYLQTTAGADSRRQFFLTTANWSRLTPCGYFFPLSPLHNSGDPQLGLQRPDQVLARGDQDASDQSMHQASGAMEPSTSLQLPDSAR